MESVFGIILATVFNLPSARQQKAAGRPEGRISNSQMAREGQFPYQVCIRYKAADGGTLQCGGALISHTEVLTAAHCIENGVNVLVLLGTTYTKRVEVSYIVKPNDFIIHPGYIKKTFINDIGIIRIPHTDYTANIQPINLPTKEDSKSEFAHKAVVFAGWGKVSESKSQGTERLRFTKLATMKNGDCLKSFPPLKPENICARSDQRSSPCSGDSGGPLVLENSQTIIGVYSSTHPNGCEDNKPTVFMRVTSYLDWIEQTRSGFFSNVFKKIGSIFN